MDFDLADLEKLIPTPEELMQASDINIMDLVLTDADIQELLSPVPDALPSYLK